MTTGAFHSQLQDFLTDKGIELQELVYGTISPAALEKKWMEAFSEKEFAEFGIGRYFPKLVRGLPRLYRRDDPMQCRIKKEFSDLASLKRLGAQKAFFSLYEDREPVKGSKIALFTWVMNDGWGDLIAGWEAIQIFKERFPDLEIRWVIVLSDLRKPLELQGDFKAYYVSGEVEGDALAALRTADCIFQIPTFYPKTQEVKEKIKQIELTAPIPKWIEVGEYGFLESDWFHPQTGRLSLGLHCLEKGILSHKQKAASFAELKNEMLLALLFGTNAPGPVEIEKYFSSHAFYLAYLSTPAGGWVYLQGLAKAHELNELQIDICTPDLGWLAKLIEEKKLGEIEHLKEIEICFDGHSYTAKVSNVGKRIRVLAPGQIGDDDFRSLVRLSGEFVGVRGDQSFSEVVSANKVYFYDGRDHAQHFIRDLAALAENRISAHRNALTIFRAMRRVHLHNLSEEKGEWVEESHFQEKPLLKEVGIEMGLALQDPDAIAGFKKLGRIISDEYSANQFLCHLVQRQLCHNTRPDLALAEEKALSEFASGALSFGESFSQMVSNLQLEKKYPVWKIRHVNAEESHDLHERLGKALRALIHLCARDEIKVKAEEIHQLAHAIGGPLAKEAEALNRHLKSLLDISKHVSESAFVLEQETREI